MWKNVVGEGMFCFVGFFGINMIVLLCCFYVIYYNIDKNIIVKVGI